MKSACLAVVAGMFFVVGCGDIGNYDPAAHASKEAAETKMIGKPKPQYVEFNHDGRIYVVNGQAMADKIKGGAKLGAKKTAIGAGPNKETIVFEANKDGLEDILSAEYSARHGVQL